MEQKYILIGIAAIIIILLLLYFFLSNDCKTCLYMHKEFGDNYVWLDALNHGKVLKIEFEEPINSGKWIKYTDKWWKTHCKVVDHNPDDLVEAHVDAFIGPNRFARLRFTFEDGTVMEPTRQFYDLEADYFRKNMC